MSPYEMAVELRKKIELARNQLEESGVSSASTEWLRGRVSAYREMLEMVAPSPPIVPVEKTTDALRADRSGI